MEHRDNQDSIHVSNHAKTMTLKKKLEKLITKTFTQQTQDQNVYLLRKMQAHLQKNKIDILYACIKMMIVNKQFIKKRLDMKMLNSCLSEVCFVF